jgi:hypothetical protein
VQECFTGNRQIVTRYCSRGLHSRHHRGFYTFSVEASIDPGAGKIQVIEACLVGFQAPGTAAGSSSNAAVRGNDIAADDLRGQSGLPVQGIWRVKYVPVEFLLPCVYRESKSERIDDEVRPR